MLQRLFSKDNTAKITSGHCDRPLHVSKNWGLLTKRFEILDHALNDCSYRRTCSYRVTSMLDDCMHPPKTTWLPMSPLTNRKWGPFTQKVPQFGPPGTPRVSCSNNYFSPSVLPNWYLYMYLFIKQFLRYRRSILVP